MFKRNRRLGIALFVLSLAPLAVARAQTVAPASPPGAPPGVHLPAGTQVTVELVEGVNSKTSHVADTFAIRLAEPIMNGDAVLLPAGALGQGEIIDSAPAGFGGKQGKLSISARYLEVDGQKIRIRGMSLIAAGQSQVNLSTGVMLVPYVGIAAFFIQGGDIQLPTGTRGSARLVQDIDLAAPPSVKPEPVSQPAPAAAPDAPVAQTQPSFNQQDTK